MQPKLLDQVRNAIRLKQYSIRTEHTYTNWVKRFILFHNKQHPREMHNAQVTAFLSYLAVKRLITRLPNGYKLIGALLYGRGLRLLECLRLRVKDFDFEYSSLHIHNGKGGKDRIVALPPQLKVPFKQLLHDNQLRHRLDLERGVANAYLPTALARKYPNAAKEWKWQYVFATHALENGIDIRTVQKQLGHSLLETTEICTHVLKRGSHVLRSPLEDIYPVFTLD